jgi:hypothetical protein
MDPQLQSVDRHFRCVMKGPTKRTKLYAQMVICTLGDAGARLFRYSLTPGVMDGIGFMRSMHAFRRQQRSTWVVWDNFSR